MPRGYPDWFGQPQFPKYGAVKNLSGSTLVPSGVETEVFSIIGKGKIYYGWIYYLTLYDSSSAYYAPIIDGTRVWRYIIDHMRQRGVYADSGYAMFLLCYDKESNLYVTGLRGDITFEKSFILLACQFSGATRNCYYDICYSLIQ